MDGLTWSILGAVIALGTAGLSTVIGVTLAGLSAAGAVTENKENFKSAMILQAMPQTQTVYAFITALFILMGTGLLTGKVPEVPEWKGMVMFGAGLLVAITSLSAIAQGRLSAAGIASCAKNPDAFAPSIVFAGQAETTAIFGFVLSLITLVVGLNVLG